MRHESYEYKRVASPLEIKNTKYTSPFSDKPKTSDIHASLKPRRNLMLPSLGPLHITLAPNHISVGEKVSGSNNDDNHSFIQSTWATFSTLNDTHRNQLLKGLLSRSSSQQIEFICTCLNIKSLDGNSFKSQLVFQA